MCDCEILWSTLKRFCDNGYKIWGDEEELRDCYSENKVEHQHIEWEDRGTTTDHGNPFIIEDNNAVYVWYL